MFQSLRGLLLLHVVIFRLRRASTIVFSQLLSTAWAVRILFFFFLNGRQHGTSPCCGGGPPEFQNPVRHFPRPGTRASGHCCVPEPALQEIATNLPLQG